MKTEDSNVTVSVRDIAAFIGYAAIIAVMAAAMYAVAPKGLGQVIGVGFAVALLPVPAIVLWFTRWRKGARESKA